ncbi:MAG: right-handed parallel beta-helix repeat-containing protein [Candidatus Rokuibacteriota bacterium]
MWQETSRVGVLAVLLAAVAVPAPAAVWRVNCDPAAFADFTTITGAVTSGSVVDGDTVVVEICGVAPFVYHELVALTGWTELHLVAADPAYFGSRTEGVGGIGPFPVIIDGTNLMGDCVTITAGTDVEIHGFRSRRCNGSGLEIVDSVRTVVEGNQIQRAGRGIRDSGGTDSRLTGNRIEQAQFEGILLEDCSQCQVADNVATTDAEAIRLDGGTACVVNNNDALSAGPEAIDVTAGTAHRIERNRAVGNANAIVIGPLATDTDVVGNDISTAIGDLGVNTELLHNF